MARKIFLLNFLLIISICSTNKIYAQPQADHFYDYKILDVNNININPNNIGCLEIDIYGNGGAFWNLITKYNNQIVYDMGPWIVGKINDSLYAAISQWGSLYSPGPVINGQAGILINPQDSLKYRVYKISKNDDISNIDYAEWPSDIGAPTTLKRSPLVLGDQTIWTIFNSVDSTLNRRNFWTDFKPLPVEIQQTIFAHRGFTDDSVNIFSNVVFIEWTIINKGSEQIDSTYFGFWTDIDFSPLQRNFPAVDTTNQLAYCWTADSSLCVGFSLLFGPIIPSTENKATFKGKSKENFKNLPMKSFHGIYDDSYGNPLIQPARTILDVWNFARGLDADGNIIINPTTNDGTVFPFDGDPVTNQGWIYSYTNLGIGGGSGFVFFSGPFDMEPLDTQWVMIALIPALGDDPYQSITNMRQKAKILHSLPYDSLAFGDYGLPPEEPIPENYMLQQNYPNPYNQGTIIKYELPSSGNVSLRIYDILDREVAKLVDEFQNEGEYNIGFNPSSLATGVYLYRLRVNDFVETKKMVLLK